MRTSYGFKPHWLGEKSPSLSLGVYYNSIRVDKNIIVIPCKYNEHYTG